MNLYPKTDFLALGDRFYSEHQPQKLRDLQLIHKNNTLIEQYSLSDLFAQDGVDYFNDDSFIDANDAVAMVYAGHQFGHFVPQLGDGRACYLANLKNQLDQSFELSLKGSGITPYSRGGDGRAVLRSTIREYLIGHYLNQIGIQSSNALATYKSSDQVMRERFENCALLLRTAKTHIRFGHFEFFAHSGQHDALKTLADYAIEQFYPKCKNDENPYDSFLLEIAQNTGEMIAKWQTFGFAHGVMNTDNLTIMGETFDFGPYAMMDQFIPDLICNASDTGGRYAFDQQPSIGHWNLMALCFAMSSLCSSDIAEKVAESYSRQYHDVFYRLMLKRLGLSDIQMDDRKLIMMLLNLLAKEKWDYSNFFNYLVKIDQVDEDRSEDMQAWQKSYFDRVSEDKNDALARNSLMNAINPKFLMRNYLIEKAIKLAEQDDFSEVEILFDLASKPFTYVDGFEHYYNDAPVDASDMNISCSS